MYKQFLFIIILAVMLISCGKSYTTVKTTDKNSDNHRQDSLIDQNSNLSRGISALELNNNINAKKLFEKHIVSNPADWEGYFYRGLTLERLKDYETALHNLYQSLNFAPRDNRIRSIIYVTLAETCEKLGQTGKAKLHFHTALNLYPDSKESKEGLARLGALTNRSR